MDELSVQVIDENKVFNTTIGTYLGLIPGAQAGGDGLDYHVVSVFGSQSTGKSTLLNYLFGTQFDVMNETKRQQTTKGIWLAHADNVASSSGAHSSANGDILVMDVEGTDGRERGEDQDFERKSLLFALATSEILIVNIWEHQVGLYQGANMGLLKTVFEVNLSLFAQNRQKSCLLFVIRDHVGGTPLEYLSNLLTEDLNKIWAQLSKPSGCEDSKITDFFDLQFRALPHKLLAADQFVDQVAVLGDEFLTKGTLFQQEYHRKIPIDGWPIYAEQIWEQIELNKDLDLPTQQVLVARFRCDEIANELYQEFETQFDLLDLTLPLKLLGDQVVALRTSTVSEFDSNASRYTKTVYLQRRKTFLQKIDSKIKELHSSILVDITNKSLQNFSEELELNRKSKSSFIILVKNAYESALHYFTTESAYISIKDESDEELCDNKKELLSLKLKLADLVNKEKEGELASINKKIFKKFNSNFKDIVYDNLSDPYETCWDKILEEFNSLVESLVEPFKTEKGYDFKLELSDEANQLNYEKIKTGCWILFDHIIHDYITEDNVLNILRNKFDQFFRYDDKGLPKIWENSIDIDNYFTEARTKTLSLLPYLCLAKLSSNVEILPDVDIKRDDDDEDEEHYFAHLLSSRQEQSVITKFKKQIDLIYTDAKRSMVQSRTSIPAYFYLLLLVLGWNELMAVLRSPILFTLLLLTALGLYLAYTLNMLRPMIQLLMMLVDNTKTVVKLKLKEVLIEDNDKKDEKQE